MKKLPFSNSSSVLAAAIATLLATHSAQAATITWANGTAVSKDAWGDKGNWNPRTVPAVADNVVFTSTGTIAVTLNGTSIGISSITLNGTGSTTLDGSLVKPGTPTGPYALTLGGTDATGGSNGLILSAGSGLFTIGSATVLEGVNVVIAKTQTWTNNSTGGLTLLNGLSSGSTGTQTLTIAGSGTTNLNGIVANGTGTFALTQSGSGTTILSKANTYTGATIINGGKLTIGATGTINSTSGVSIGAGEFNYNSTTALSKGVSFSSTGGTLSGSGTITPAVNVTTSNTLAPGTGSIGTLSFSTGLTLAGTYAAQLGTAGATAIAGVSDRAAVTGNLTLTGSTLSLSDNAGANSRGPAGAGSYRLVTYTGSLTGTFGTVTNPLSATLHQSVIYGAGTVDLNLYYLAAAAGTQTVNVGNMHVGGTKTAAVTLVNTAATNATYTETLSSGAFSGTSSNFTAAGSVSGIAGGSSSSGTMLVGLGSGLAAGAASGTTTLALNSDAVNSSGLGTTGLPAQTITITGGVYNLAAANAISTPVNLGNVHVGGTFGTSALTLTNTAASGSYTEKLDGAFTGATGSASNAGSVSLLAGQGSDTTSLLVGLGGSSHTGTAGAITGTTTLGLTSNGSGTSGLGTTGLSAQTITVNGLVYSGQSSWSGGNGSWGTLASGFGTKWGANQGSPGLDTGFTDVDTASFTGAGGTVALDGASPSLKTLDLSGTSAYTIAQGTGSTSLQFKSDAGDASLTAASGGHLISAPVTLASNLTATVTGSSHTLTLSGAISGSGILTKAGDGTLALSGSNSYGSTQLDAGTLSIGAASALGSGSITFNGGVLDVTSTFTLGNAIVVNNANYGVSVASNKTLTLSGAISGSYGLHKDGYGSVVITSASNSSPTIINTGTVTATADNAGSSVSIASGATLAFDQDGGAGTYSGALSGAGNVGVTGALTLSGSNSDFSGNIEIGGNSTLTVASQANLGSTTAQIALVGSPTGTSALHFSSNSPSAYANNITVNADQGILHNTGSGTVTLGGTLSKDGSVLVLQGGAFNLTGSITGASANSDMVVDNATVTLSGSGDYKGPTSIINGGKLLINGTLAAGSDITVASTGTLGGLGSIGGNVMVDASGTLAPGDIAPGTVIGKLTVGGNLTFAAGSTFAYEMNSSVDKSLAGDLLVVEGLGGVSLGANVELTLSDQGAGTFAPGTTLSLIQYEGEWNQGLFIYDGNVLHDGDEANFNGNHWTIHYNASTGGKNFITTLVDSKFISLSLTAIPEVGGLLGLGCLVSSGAFFRSRRRGGSPV